jgi:capsular exopolysaccharide synthesis family protein
MENIVSQADQEHFERRLFVIQRQITNPDFLGDIAREFNLYPKEQEQGGETSAVMALIDAINVERVKTDQAGNLLPGTSGIAGFTVSFLYQDAMIARKVTARIVEKFIEENIKEREYNAEGTSRFLDDELRRMKLDLEKKEEQISAFKKSHTGELPQQTDLRLLDRLESEITLASENVQRHSDRLATLNRAVQEYQLYGWQNPAFGTSAAEPDPLFRQLRELREKLVKLKAEFRDEYPEVLLTKEELRKIEEELVESYGPDAIRPDKTPRDPYVQNLLKLQSDEKSELNLAKQRLEGLQAKLQEYERQLARSPQVEQDLLMLERDYISMKANYATLLDKRLQARVTENLEKQHKNGKFRVLDAASLPRSPSVPNRQRVMMFGFLLGSVSGIGFSILRERLSPQFRKPEDVDLLHGPQLLATIPDFTFLWQSKRRPALTHAYRSGRSIETADGPSLEIAELRPRQQAGPQGAQYEKRFVARLFPHSMAAEQYRVAAARLQLVNEDAGSKVVAVTSAIKGEGKTTTVMNLGYTLARDFGKRVLVIDCDFAFPELRCFTETRAQYGLVDCLRGDIAPELAMTALSDSPCWIMEAGECGPDSTVLLKTGPFERLLAQLREKFEYILLNSPPILPVATMNVLERHSDFLLLVVKANMTSQHMVKRALDSLRVSQSLHVILNGVPMESLPYYTAGYAAIADRPHV